MACIPYQDLSQRSRHLLVNVLLRACELDVHVAVDADKAALIFSLAPLQAHDDFLVNTITGVCQYTSCIVINLCSGMTISPSQRPLQDIQVLQHRPRVYGHYLRAVC